jgi:glycosyltransferase involved in cell wall biosynthesis
MRLPEGSAPADRSTDPPGLRVVLDARPLQDRERSPSTARYLEGLLGAYDAHPVAGESFALLLQSDLEDPTARYHGLEVVGRRLLPPTRRLRASALAVDPFLLRGASVGAAWRAERSGAAGAVYHAVGGAAPLFSRIPTVVTLLDLAPWEMPGAFQRSPAARFGIRMRTQLLRDAAAVIVGTDAVARAARRLLRIRAERLRVVPLAPAAAFVAAAEIDPIEAAREERARLGLPDRYLVYPGRYDARHDVGTLLRALAALAAVPRPRSLPAGVPWPPHVVLVDASPDDRAALARAALRHGVDGALAYAPTMPDERLAALVRGARAVLLPANTDAAGLAALDALAAGVPVVATTVGALPEIVGPGGILVGPRDPDRLVEALRTAWADERLHGRLVAAAAVRARAVATRTWEDVARETREVYAAVGIRA